MPDQKINKSLWSSHLRQVFWRQCVTMHVRLFAGQKKDKTHTKKKTKKKVTRIQVRPKFIVKLFWCMRPASHWFIILRPVERKWKSVSCACDRVTVLDMRAHYVSKNNYCSRIRLATDRTRTSSRSHFADDCFYLRNYFRGHKERKCAVLRLPHPHFVE